MTVPASFINLLTEFVRTSPRQRISLEEIRSYVARTDPGSLGDPDARRHLCAALEELSANETVKLPARTRKSNWDNRSSPALPAWVDRPPRPKPTPKEAARVWPAALEAAAAIASRPDEHELLSRIARWMRQDADPEPVPIEERSLQILGNEKALGTQRSSRIFLAGALTLDLLRCYETPLPFASQHVPGNGPTCLLASENNAGYHSLLSAARALNPATRPDLHVAWGGGKQFPVSIAGVKLLDPQPASLLYIGDLDLDGLRIAVAATRAATKLGLPPVRPASQLYRWMQRYGILQDDNSNLTASTRHDTLLDWLPDDLRSFTATLLSNRKRIAQETVGMQVLRGRPDLLISA